MSTLNEYLKQKREASIQYRKRAEQSRSFNKFEAKVRAAGRSGVREIRIRNFQIISDSPEDYAGYDLGPKSPELQLGVLGSCMTHIALIQAADLGITMDSLEIKVTGQEHPLAGREGFEAVPPFLHNIKYEIHIQSDEPAERIKELHDAIERVCPVYNLLKNPQEITGEIIQTPSSGSDRRG